MKTFLRWIARTVGSAISLVLVIVLFPYVSDIAANLLPDESGSAIKASAIIATRLKESARLETLCVEEEGVLNYDIQAAFVGSVASINIKYRYNGSFGIDLAKVELIASGNELIIRLPYPELMQDSLTPLETYRDDFWYPGFSDDDYVKLLEHERAERRDVYLSGEKAAKLQNTSISMFEKTIAKWLTDVNSSLNIRYEMTDILNTVE